MPGSERGSNNVCYSSFRNVLVFLFLIEPCSGVWGEGSEMGKLSPAVQGSDKAHLIVPQGWAPNLTAPGFPFISIYNTHAYWHRGTHILHDWLVEPGVVPLPVLSQGRIMRFLLGATASCS